MSDTDEQVYEIRDLVVFAVEWTGQEHEAVTARDVVGETYGLVGAGGERAIIWPGDYLIRVPDREGWHVCPATLFRTLYRPGRVQA